VVADTWAPSVSPLLLPSSLLFSAPPDRAPPQSSPRPAASFPLPFRPSQPIKAINRRLQSPAVSPSPYSLHARTIRRPSLASRRPPRRLISPLPHSLFKAELELPLSPLHLFRTYTRTRASHTPSAAALSPPPPLGKLISGEGLPLLSISSSLMFLPALTEPIVPQVHVLDVLRSCAPITPERRPTRRHSRTSSPSPPLRPRARQTLLHVVSKASLLTFLFLAHNSHSTGSPARPTRPLPAPAAVDARASPLTS
jgi:hypothetical protein